MKRQRCSQCLNDQTVRHIEFESDKRCNFCHSYDTIMGELNDRKELQRLFKQRINAVKGKHRYDAAVGISGGKDSVYILYQLKNKYHLKIKAFTIDNGFLTQAARDNIDKIVKELQVEHEYITFDDQTLKKFYRYSMKKWLVPCIACAYIGYTAMVNYTMKIDAGLCIHGRSLSQMLRYYGFDVFTELVNAGLKDLSAVNIDKLYTKILAKVEKNIDSGLMQDMKEMLYDGVRKQKIREFVAYFLYHPYNEAQIVKFLEKNTTWRKQAQIEHFDCAIHNATQYIYQCAEGRPHALPEISVLVRSGAISRQEAQRILDQKVLKTEPSAELKQLCKYVNLNKTLLLLKAKLYQKAKQYV